MNDEQENTCFFNCSNCGVWAKEVEEKNQQLSVLQKNIFDIKSNILKSSNIISSYIQLEKENEIIKKENETWRKLKQGNTDKYQFDLMKKKIINLTQSNQELELKYNQTSAELKEMEENCKGNNSNSRENKLKRELSEKDKEINRLNTVIATLRQEHSAKDIPIQENNMKKEEDDDLEELGFNNIYHADLIGNVNEAGHVRRNSIEKKEYDKNVKLTEWYQEKEYWESKYKDFRSRYLKYKHKFREFKKGMRFCLNNISIFNKSTSTSTLNLPGLEEVSPPDNIVGKQIMNMKRRRESSVSNKEIVTKAKKSLVQKKSREEFNVVQKENIFDSRFLRKNESDEDNNYDNDDDDNQKQQEKEKEKEKEQEKEHDIIMKEENKAIPESNKDVINTTSKGNKGKKSPKTWKQKENKDQSKLQKTTIKTPPKTKEKKPKEKKDVKTTKKVELQKDNAKPKVISNDQNSELDDSSDNESIENDKINKVPKLQMNLRKHSSLEAKGGKTAEKTNSIKQDPPKAEKKIQKTLNNTKQIPSHQPPQPTIETKETFIIPNFQHKPISNLPTIKQQQQQTPMQAPSTDISTSLKNMINDINTEINDTSISQLSFGDMTMSEKITLIFEIITLNIPSLQWSRLLTFLKWFLTLNITEIKIATVNIFEFFNIKLSLLLSSNKKFKPETIKTLPASLDYCIQTWKENNKACDLFTYLLDMLYVLNNDVSEISAFLLQTLPLIKQHTQVFPKWISLLAITINTNKTSNKIFLPQEALLQYMLDKNRNSFYFINRFKMKWISQWILSILISVYSNSPETDQLIKSTFLTLLNMVIDCDWSTENKSKISWNDWNILQLVQWINIIISTKDMNWIYVHLFSDWIWEEFNKAKEFSYKRAVIVYITSYLLYGLLNINSTLTPDCCASKIFCWLFSIYNPSDDVKDKISFYDQICALSWVIDSKIIAWYEKPKELIKGIIKNLMNVYSVDIFPNDFVDLIKRNKWNQ